VISLGIFVSLLSLIAYCRILRLLKEKKINGRMSVKDVLFQFSKIYLVDVCNKTILAEMPSMSRDLAELLGLNPEPFPKSVPS
jgi:hypothetical protein